MGLPVKVKIVTPDSLAGVCFQGDYPKYSTALSQEDCSCSVY